MGGRFRAGAWKLGMVLLVMGAAACGSSQAPPVSHQPAPAPPPVAAPNPAIGAAVAPTSSMPAGPSEHLRIAWTATSGGYLPLHAARERGFFEKRGLAAELTFISAAQAVSALLAREVDVVCTDGAALVRANLAGGDTVMLGGTSLTFAHKLVAHPTLQRPEDLRGKRLGISRIGSTTDFAARYLLRGIGLGPEAEVSLVQAGGLPEILQAMAAGGIDAGLLSEPVVHEARKQGFIVLYDLASLGVEYPTNGFGVLRGTVNERPEALRAFVGGMVEAIAWVKQNRVEAMEILAHYTRMEDPDTLTATYEEGVQRFPQAPYPTVASIVTILESIRDTEPRAASARPADFIDDRFVRELDESGYIRQLYP
jgi:NitT/TauT family transport system substrate-binding protein